MNDDAMEPTDPPFVNKWTDAIDNIVSTFVCERQRQWGPCQIGQNFFNFVRVFRNLIKIVGLVPILGNNVPLLPENMDPLTKQRFLWFKKSNIRSFMGQTYSKSIGNLSIEWTR